MFFNKYYHFIIFVILLLFLNKSNCQSANNSSSEENLLALSEFIINSDEYNELNELDKIDKLYLESLRLTENNISEALLLLTFATLPYNKVPLQLPILNFSYMIPLPSPDDFFFIERRRHIPGIVLFESSERVMDRDKIPHFFGNAFIAYNSTLFNFSKFLGILIELFEETLISGNELDLRDLMLNGLGAMFGYSLRNVEQFKPSEMMKYYSILYFRLY